MTFLGKHLQYCHARLTTTNFKENICLSKTKKSKVHDFVKVSALKKEQFIERD